MPRIRTMHKRPRLRMGADPQESSSDDDDDAGVTCDGDRVFFYAEVSRKTVLRLIKCLATASTHALTHATSVPDATVYLFIHSSGGDAYAGLSAFDHIRNSRVHVTTVIDGFVASAATFLLLGGERRAAMKHSAMLVHQLSTGFWGKFADLVDEVQNSTSLMETIKKVYADHTTLSRKRIDSLLNKEKNIDAERCLAMGFVHELW